MRRWCGRSERRRLEAAAAVVVTALVLVGCPFDPRDPPPPGWPTPCDSTLLDQTPSNIRRKIVRAFECRRASIYGECLSTEFVYEPDPAANAARPGFFDPWTPERELGSMQEALAGTGAPQAVRMRILRFRDTGELTGDQARFDVQYELRFIGAADTVFFGGCAVWDFNGVQALRARLNRWTDLFSFGPGGCTPDSTAVGPESSGFLRIRSGVN